MRYGQWGLGSQRFAVLRVRRCGTLFMDTSYCRAVYTLWKMEAVEGGDVRSTTTFTILDRMATYENRSGRCGEPRERERDGRMDGREQVALAAGEVLASASFCFCPAAVGCHM